MGIVYYAEVLKKLLPNQRRVIGATIQVSPKEEGDHVAVGCYGNLRIFHHVACEFISSIWFHYFTVALLHSCHADFSANKSLATCNETILTNWKLSFH